MPFPDVGGHDADMFPHGPFPAVKSSHRADRELRRSTFTVFDVSSVHKNRGVDLQRACGVGESRKNLSYLYGITRALLSRLWLGVVAIDFGVGRLRSVCDVCDLQNSALDFCSHSITENELITAKPCSIRLFQS